RESNLASAMESLQSMASRVAMEQGKVIEYAHQTVELLSLTRDLDNASSRGDCHRFLSRIVKNEQRLSNIAIADRDGLIFCNSAETSIKVSIADRSYFRDALSTNDLVTGSAVYDRSVGTWSLPFAKALHDDEGHLQGYLVVLVDLQWVNRELAKVKLPEGARSGLIDATGTVLARYPDPERWVGKSAAHTAFYSTILSLRGKGTAESTGFDGVPRIYGFASIASASTGPIHLWIGIPRGDVTGQAERRFALTFSLLLVLLIFAFAAVWYGSERLLLHPLSVISEVAKRLGRGEQDARTNLDYASGELGQLAQTIDEMAIALLSKNEILRLNRAMRILSLCNKALVHAQEEQQLLEEVCRIIVINGNYRMAWVGFAENDEQKSVRPVASFGFEEGYLENARISWADTERGRGPSGTAIRTGKLQVNREFATNPDLVSWREEALKRGYRSSTSLPLSDRSETFGALTLYSQEPFSFSADELSLLEELATDLSFGIRALRIRASHDAWSAKLERSMISTVEAVAGMLEMRDPYTAGHQRKVADLAVAIAREMNLPEEEARGIHLAGMVHDIGKIQVPAEILSKPTRLTDVEYLLIKEHARAGYEILKGIDFSWPIAQLVHQHHERIDGSGYPEGLKGMEILMGAKILAVAYTVESMAAHRPYRPALGLDAALAEIERTRGIVYEAAAVDACLRLFREKHYRFPS
ncbi:MAG: GAF domain-containing protein, partial [Burkholderiales bacterium]|nr:GAF domain-containing protein [Burkholderiales bacterium]